MSAMLSLKMVSGTPYNINYVSIFLLDVSRAQLLDGLWYSLRLQYVFIFLFLLNVWNAQLVDGLWHSLQHQTCLNLSLLPWCQPCVAHVQLVNGLRHSLQHKTCFYLPLPPKRLPCSACRCSQALPTTSNMFLSSAPSLMSAKLSLKMVSGTPLWLTTQNRHSLVKYNTKHVYIFLFDACHAQLLQHYLLYKICRHLPFPPLCQRQQYGPAGSLHHKTYLYPYITHFNLPLPPWHQPCSACRRSLALLSEVQHETHGHASSSCPPCSVCRWSQARLAQNVSKMDRKRNRRKKNNVLCLLSTIDSTQAF